MTMVVPEFDSVNGTLMIDQCIDKVEDFAVRIRMRRRRYTTLQVYKTYGSRSIIETIYREKNERGYNGCHC